MSTAHENTQSTQQQTHHHHSFLRRSRKNANTLTTSPFYRNPPNSNGVFILFRQRLDASTALDTGPFGARHTAVVHFLLIPIIGRRRTPQQTPTQIGLDGYHLLRCRLQCRRRYLFLGGYWCDIGRTVDCPEFLRVRRGLLLYQFNIR